MDKEIFIKLVQKELGEDKMTFADLIRREGRKEEGKMLGEKEAKKTIAQKLLKEGAEVAFVTRITQLSLEEVEELAESTV